MYEITWEHKNAERVAVDPSNFRNCEDSIGHVYRNQSGNPPTYPPTQSSDIGGFPRISTEQLFLKTTTNTRV